VPRPSHKKTAQVTNKLRLHKSHTPRTKNKEQRTKNTDSVPVLTPDEFMSLGLMMGGYGEERVSQKSNMDRFKSIYGSLPHVYAQLWEDLITTDIAEARIGTGNIRGTTPYNFLIAINFLKCYQTDKSKSSHLNVCENTAQKWCWYFTAKIAALQAGNVSLIPL
jgi:hypothetical protein